MPDFSFEKKYHQEGFLSVGVDEVGRGCLAGPVVTAAVCFHSDWISKPKDWLASQKLEWVLELDDSKKLSASKRKEFSQKIWQNAYVQVSWCLTDEIDQFNILHASMIAMRRSLWPFQGLAQVVLVDGNQDPFHTRYRAQKNEAKRLGFQKVETLVKGDSKSLSIAAASIVAKVYRDDWMHELDHFYPGYGFSKHKGYSTAVHKAALEKQGACALHRRSFEPVKSMYS